MEKNWELEFGLASGGITVGLRRYRWPTPNETIDDQPEPILALALGPHPIGEARALNAGSRAKYRKIGRLMFTPPQTPFNCRGSGGEMLVAVCAIRPDLFGRIAGQVDWDEPTLEASRDIHCRPIEAAMERLLREAEVPGFASDIMLEAGGVMIGVEVARFLRSPTMLDRPTARQLDPRQLRMAEDLIENGVQGLSEIARGCGLSVRTFTRSYKAATGRTISTAIEQSRVRRAKTLLGDRSLPLKIVAHQTGFASAASFGAAFRRATGQTPGEYRSQSI